MHLRSLAAAAAFLTLGVAVHTPAMAESVGSTLTLDLALQKAEQANPQLQARIGQMDAAEGLRVEARAWANSNPQLSLQQVRRTVPQAGAGPDQRSDWNVALSQTLEIAGQPGYRRESANAALAALREEIRDTRAQVRADVSDAYYRVLVLQARDELEARAVTLFDGTAAAMEKRRRAGEDTRLDANVAQVEAQRARNAGAQVQEQLVEARMKLAALLQMPPTDLPRVEGDLAPRPSPYTVEGLLAQVDVQPRLSALAQREAGAAARLNLELASRYPDVTVGVGYGREGASLARERTAMVTVSVPLPIFKRNDAGIGQARSELTQSRIERQATARDTRAQVSGLWARYTSLESRVQRLERGVVATLDDNQQLAATSQRAGQIGLLDLLVVNRQALDARRDLLDALGDYQATRIALERAAGWVAPGSPRP